MKRRSEPLNQLVALLLSHIYKPIYFFISLFTDFFSLALKAEQPHKDVSLSTLSGPAKRNRFVSVEGNILLCNDDREGWPGQRWGEPLTPSEPRSVPVTTGLMMNSWTRGQYIWWPLVSLAGQQTDVSLTQSALISWPVEAGNHGGDVVSVDHWIWSIKAASWSKKSRWMFSFL